MLGTGVGESATLGSPAGFGGSIDAIIKAGGLLSGNASFTATPNGLGGFGGGGVSSPSYLDLLAEAVIQSKS